MRGRRQRGQTGTEYLLVISVIVIAVVGAAFVFVEPFRLGVEKLGRDVSQVLALGDIGGIGHGGSQANGGTPKTLPGDMSLADAPSPDTSLGNPGLANGGSNGMQTNNNVLGQPAAINAPAAPTGGMANGGPGAVPP